MSKKSIFNLILLSILCLFSFITSTSLKKDEEDNTQKSSSIHSEDESTYSTTWSSSQILLEEAFNPPLPLSGNTLRQIFHVSIGGELIRLKFSNLYGQEKLVIKSARIARTKLQGSEEIDSDTDESITFGGEKQISILPGEETYSDTFSYTLIPQDEVAISIYFGDVPKILTGHPASQTNSFIQEGKEIKSVKFSTSKKVAHWYFVSSIEVSSKPAMKTIVCFGDAITDGNGSTIDKHHRWSDFLSFQLNTRRATRNIGVVNAGSSDLLTTTGIERFERDALNIKGAAYVIIQSGINDIILLNKDNDTIVNAYQKIIKKGHKANKLIYGTTLLPFKHHFLYSDEKEEVRKSVNEWIRNTLPEDGGFDKVFDFDQVVRDPLNPSFLDSYYDSGNGLYLNDDGYQMLVYAIDDISVFFQKPDFDIYKLLTSLTIQNSPGVMFKLSANIGAENDVSVSVVGSCKGSKGFRLWMLNKNEERTTGYFKTGPIKEGKFEFTASFSTLGTTTYLLVKGPMSTIDIDEITIESITVKVVGVKTVYDPSEGIPYKE